CHAWRATPVVVRCHCDDPAEVARRIRVRSGREHEPPNEASDLSVFRDIARRWSDPTDDRLPDGRTPPLIAYDTVTGAVEVRAGEELTCGLERIVAVLRQDAPLRGSSSCRVAS